ncbi:MAG: SPASM domain-containing protein [Candidatus Hydrogenedentes bacterium]|nr:SPASM domain-containing protein [Candidatus Hydrogenedentota bacterium]
MPRELIHRFELDGKRFAMDPESCFCFECDAASWDVLEYFPQVSVNRIFHLLREKHSEKELSEVIGELEWLRATKSILSAGKPEDLKKQFEVEHGLKRLTVQLPSEEPQRVEAKRGWFGRGATVISNPARSLGQSAVDILLARAEQQKELQLEFLEESYVRRPDLIAELCDTALRAARLADKSLTVAVNVSDLKLKNLPPSLQGHHLSATLEVRDPQQVSDHLRALGRGAPDTLARLVKVLQPDADGVTGRIIVQPRHADFGNAVEDLDKAGFTTIELDLDGAYVANPSLKPSDMLEGLSQSAVYYAQCLLKHHYFRLDPIASLFWRIYDGAPLRRADPAATNELAVDEKGDVYPSPRFFGLEEFRCGSIAEGRIDREKLAPFDDLGSPTTAVCRTCWARNLCGGGASIVHFRLGGSIRAPHGPWCDAQRAWMASAIAAFHVLSSEGVNFTRVYHNLTRNAKPSFFTMVRAAFRMTVGMRPIEESDAPMLVRWENWNDAAYFVFNETGILMATKYDREMDSLHPQGIEQELILQHRDGQAFGLLKIRPDRVPGIAHAWVYIRDEKDYRSDSVRKGFRTLLKEAGGQQSIRRLTVPATEKETALQDFLLSLGFERAGVHREALFLHGKYHNVPLFILELTRL